MWAASAPLGASTNNVAEYDAAIAGLHAAAQISDVAALHCRGYSTLVVRQIEGRWQVNAEHLALLVRQARGLETALGVPVTWEARPREENWRADALASDAAHRCRQRDMESRRWWGEDAAARVD